MINEKDACSPLQERSKPTGDGSSELQTARELDTNDSSSFLRWRIGPFWTIVLSIGIVFVAILWSLILPGVVAYHDGVFYDDDAFLTHLPSAAKAEIGQFRAEKQKQQDNLAAVDSLLHGAFGASRSNAQDVSDLLKTRTELAAELETMKPKVSAIPFYLNPQMLLWPAIYSALGLLVFVVPPYFVRQQPISDRIRKSLVLGLMIYVVYEWPLWMRNVFTAHGRTVYGYPNIDVDKGSFIMQELVIGGFCMLLGFLWAQWTCFFNLSASASKRKQAPDDSWKAAFDAARVNEVSLLFTHWQVASLILGAGFFFFTQFFWGIVGKLNDQRYILSALVAHGLWGVSWILMTLPLMSAWRDWSQARIKALTHLATRQETSGIDAKLAADLLKEVQPVAWTNLFFTQAAAGLTFVLPLAQVLLK
jgi:hypothetical protein